MPELWKELAARIPDAAVVAIRTHSDDAGKRYEIWSRRCRRVSMWTKGWYAKLVTRRYERRVAKQIERDFLAAGGE